MGALFYKMAEPPGAFFNHLTDRNSLGLVFKFLPIKSQYSLAMTCRAVYEFYLDAEYLRPTYYSRPVGRLRYKQPHPHILYNNYEAYLADCEESEDNDEWDFGGSIRHIFTPRYYGEYLICRTLARSRKPVDHTYNHYGRLVGFYAPIIDLTINSRLAAEPPVLPGDSPIQIFRRVNTRWCHKVSVLYVNGPSSRAKQVGVEIAICEYPKNDLAPVFTLLSKFRTVVLRARTDGHYIGGAFSISNNGHHLVIRMETGGSNATLRPLNFGGLGQIKEVTIQEVALNGQITGELPFVISMSIEGCDVHMVDLCPNLERLVIRHPIFSGYNKLNKCHKLKALTLISNPSNFVYFFEHKYDLTHQLDEINIHMQDFGRVICLEYAMQRGSSRKARVKSLNIIVGRLTTMCPDARCINEYLMDVMPTWFNYENLEFL